MCQVNYYPKKTYSGVQYHGIRPPRKDGYFEHPANCVEYLVTAFAPADAASLAGVLRNPEATRKATKLTETTSLTKDEIAAVVLGGNAKRILEARLEQKRYDAQLKESRNRRDHDRADPYLARHRGGGHMSFSRGGYTRQWGGR